MVDHGLHKLWLTVVHNSHGGQWFAMVSTGNGWLTNVKQAAIIHGQPLSLVSHSQSGSGHIQTWLTIV